MEQETIDTILRNQFKISYLRPFQELIINHIFEAEEEGRKCNIIAILPTGGGKSLCFMLPEIAIRKLTIIVYPLISLMNDQRERFEKAGISYEILKGGMSRAEKREAIERLKTGDSIAMITNVEMLSSLVESGMLAPLYDKVSMLVVDEAHTVETWGNTFRPSYKKLSEIRKKLSPKHTLAFTATLDKKDLEGIERSIFNNEHTYTVRASSDRENIFYHSIATLNKEKEIENILSKEGARPAIIFVNSRVRAEELALKLGSKFNARFYHAGLEYEKKKEIEGWFSTSTSPTLVATIAFGLGVDAKSTRTVIHHYLPQDATNFLQEAGRAGRDGKSSESYVLFYPWEDSPIKDVFTSTDCIRGKLLRMMDEESEETSCLGCSHCVDDGYVRVGEKEILRYIGKHRYRTKETIISKLTEKAFWKRRNVLSNWSEKEISRALRILEEEKTIKSAKNRYTLKNDNSLIWFCINSYARIEKNKRR